MVKDLLHAFLATSKTAVASPESFNSQIGVPLSLFTLSKKHQIAVIEAGFSEKGEMERLADMIQPNYGLITHLGKKHLATLGDLDSAIQELLKLFCTKHEWTFVPSHHLLKPYLTKISAQIHFWNRSEKELPSAELTKGYERYQIHFPNQAIFQGTITSGFSYYLDLINMAVKAAWKLGIGSEAISSVLQHYVVEPMRTEIWRSPQMITFINESYCSDPQSVDKSLRIMQNSSDTGRRHFIFGGLRGEKRPEDYIRMASTLSKAKIDCLCLYGPYIFEPLIREMQTQSPSTTIFKAEDYREALQLLTPYLRPQDTLLIQGAKKIPFEYLLQHHHENILTNLCIVNLAAIEANIRTLRARLPKGTRIMAMVKAAAYGTDDLRLAKFLATCKIDILGVSYVDEAVALLRGGAKQSLFVLNAARYEIPKVVKWGLEVGVSDKIFVQLLAKEAEQARKNIKVHLHIDTGMCRFGCRSEEVLDIARAIADAPYLRLEGILTHFASADNPEQDEFTLSQVEKLTQVIAELKKEGFDPPWKHAANSSAALRFSLPEFNMVRLGLAILAFILHRLCKRV